MARNKGWFRLYDRMIDSPEVLDLSDLEFRVLVSIWCLASAADDSGRIRMSETALSRRIGVPSDELATCLRHLCDKELLSQSTDSIVVNRWEEHQYQSPSLTPKRRAEQKRIEREKAQKAKIELSQNVATPDSDSDTDTDTDIKDPPNPRKRGNRVRKEIIYSPNYCRFYGDEYPKKVAKEDGQKAWNELNLEEDVDLIKVLVRAVRLQRKTEDWVKERGRYVPHIATWLRGKRWLDEVSPPPPESTVYDEPDATDNERFREWQQRKQQAKN